MENKKSFLLYADIMHTVNKLPDEKAGQLFKLILSYVNDEDPETEDLILQIAFEPIKQNLKRDLEKWKNKAETARANGKKGGRPPKKTESVNLEPKKAVNVNVNVNDNVTVINKEQLKLFYDLLQKHYNSALNKQTRVFPEKIKKKYYSLLKEGYTLEDIQQAITNAACDNYHKETNPSYKHLTLEFFSRPDKIDKFANQSNKKTKYIPTK